MYHGNMFLMEKCRNWLKKCEEIKLYDGFTAEIKNTDLDIPSIKVVDHNKEDNTSMTYYFIDDNEGGVYKVFVNSVAFDAFSAEKEMKEVLDSMKVVSKDKNSNLKKIKVVEPFLG